VRRLSFLVAALGYICPLYPQTAPRDNTANVLDFRKALSRLREEWKQGNIEKVQIVHIASDVRYPVRVTPERLEDWCAFKLFVYEPKEHNVTRELFAKVENVSGKSSEEPQDMLWGFIFFDRKGNRVFSIYFNQFREATIEGEHVSLDSDELLKWAVSTLGAVLR